MNVTTIGQTSPQGFIVQVGDGIAVHTDIETGETTPTYWMVRLATYRAWNDVQDQTGADAAQSAVAASRATIDLPDDEQVNLSDDTVAKLTAASGAAVQAPEFVASLVDGLVAETGLGETARPWAQQTVDEAYVATNLGLYSGMYHL